MIIALLLIVATFLLYYGANKIQYLKRKKIGDIGEKIVQQLLSQLNGDYRVKHNVRFRGQQIDHIVIQGGIIYVIETKHYGGFLTGRVSDKYLNHNGYMVYNPVKQNKKHCDIIKQIYPYGYVVSIVCFTGNCNVNIKGNSKCIILNHKELLNYIKRTSC